MEVEEPRGQELAGCVEPFGAGWDIDLSRGADRFNPIATNQNRCLFVDRSRSVEDGPALDCQPSFLALYR